MHSERRHLLWVLVFILAGAGCSEELAIEPITASADDWTPSYTIKSFGYQRVAVAIEGPPRRELVPNIARYIFSIRGLLDSVDIPIDTIAYVTPSFVEAPGIYANVWWTDPRVPTGASFSTKLTVEYHNGVTRSTSGAVLPADPARGTILRRFDLSSATPGTQWWLTGSFALWGSRPIFNSNERLYVLDTATGTPQYLGDLVIPGSDPSGSSLYGFGVDGDTLIVGVRPATSSAMRLVKVNLNTMAADSSLSISWGSTEYGANAAINGGKIFVLLLLSDGRTQIRSFDSRTGLTIQSYPPGTPSSGFLSGLSYDGSDLWVAMAPNPFGGPMPWFNPIYRLDPTTLAFTQVHRNPLWHSNHCLVGTPTSWLLDETSGRALVEARLEGF